MKTIGLISCFVCFSLMSCRQHCEFDYFGLPGPGDSIKLFAPDIVSLKDSKEKSLAISPNGDEDSFDISCDGRFIFIYKQDDVYWTETKEVLGNM